MDKNIEASLKLLTSMLDLLLQRFDSMLQQIQVLESRCEQQDREVTRLRKLLEEQKQRYS